MGSSGRLLTCLPRAYAQTTNCLPWVIALVRAASAMMGEPNFGIWKAGRSMRGGNSRGREAGTDADEGVGFEEIGDHASVSGDMSAVGTLVQRGATAFFTRTCRCERGRQLPRGSRNRAQID